jgi:hypothetical protein
VVLVAAEVVSAALVVEVSAVAVPAEAGNYSESSFTFTP